MNRNGFSVWSSGPSQLTKINRHPAPLGKSWRWIMVALVALSLTLAFLAPTWAGDGALDPTFTNPMVQKIPVVRGKADYQDSSGNANGNSLIFGYFTSVTGSNGTFSINSIAFLPSTGGVDSTFNIPINGEIRTAILTAPKTATSDIVIGGNFSVTSNGTTYYNLARLTWDSTNSVYVVDTTFPQIFNQVATENGIPVSAVNVIAKQGSSGTFLVGGYNMQVLASAGGDTTKAYHLIHLNSDWTYDSTYSTNNPDRALPGGNVNSINLSDPAYPNQARIFGTLPKAGGGNDWMELTDTSFSPIQGLGSGQLDGPIFGMALVSSGGPWVIWGNFRTAFGTAINRVALVNNGLTDLDNTSASFNSGVIGGGGANHTVQQAIPQFPNSIILAGSLTKFNGITCGHLVRITSSGTVDATFNSGGSGLDDRTFKMYIPNGGANINIVGAFRNYNNGSDNARHGIVVIDGNGGLQGNYAQFSADSSTPGTVIALEDSGKNDGSIIIGGDFTGVGGKWHQNLGKVNWDGSSDNSFTANVDGEVSSLRSNNGSMLVAGNFGAADGVGRTSLARLNPDFSLDGSFHPTLVKGDGTLAGIRMAEADNSGLIIVGGGFASVNGDTTRTGVVRLLSTGALDTSFTFTPPSGLTKIKVNAGGNMGGKYPIVGRATYGGNTRGFGCRLNSDGTVDSSFAINQSPVANVALFDNEVQNGTSENNGSIYLCGNFTMVNDGTNFTIARGRIARFNPNGTLDTTWVPAGANDTIYSLDIQPNGKLLIGGMFTAYGSASCNAFTRLNHDGSPDTSFNVGGTGPNGPVALVSWWGNPNVFIGGNFTTYNAPISASPSGQMTAVLGTPMGSLARIISHSIAAPAPNLLLLLDN